MNDIIDYVIGLAPSVASVLALVASVLVSIHKFKTLNKDTIGTIDNLANNMLRDTIEERQANQELRLAIAALLEENRELKEELRDLRFRRPRRKEE